VLCTQAYVLAEAGEEGEEIKLAKQAFSAAKAVSDQEQKTSALSYVAATFRDLGEFDQALGVMQEMVDELEKANVLIGVARALAEEYWPSTRICVG
jgi:hypothetical protein